MNAGRRVSIQVEVRDDYVSLSVGGAGMVIPIDLPPESDSPMAQDGDFESRIDRIKREAKEQRDAAGQANKEFGQGCRRLLLDLVKPLFERTRAKLGRDDDLAVNWSPAGEDEIHLTVQNKRTRRAYSLFYHCDWSDRRVRRRTTIKPPAGTIMEWDHTDNFELLDLSQEVLEDHLEEFLRLAFSGSSAARLMTR